jgi:hypothetical protein
MKSKSKFVILLSTISIQNVYNTIIPSHIMVRSIMVLPSWLLIVLSSVILDALTQSYLVIMVWKTSTSMLQVAMANGFIVLCSHEEIVHTII